MSSRWHIASVILLVVGVVCGTILLAHDWQQSPPPPSLAFDGLPISGSLKDATRMGFTDCYQSDATRMRCRRHGVIIEGHGPFEAAVDLVGSDGSGGFDQLILWHDRDQYAVYAVADLFEHQGWHSCNTGNQNWGDQIIYKRKGARFRVSMDLSYYAKRRLRLIPTWKTGRSC
jgi:hypothetical protein